MNLQAQISTDEVARFAHLIEHEFGLLLGGRELANLALLLRKRIEATGCAGASSYMDRIGNRWREELDVLASLVTVTESYFLRSPEHLAALLASVIPELRCGDSLRPIRILSAGCASGEAAFSIAIELLEDRRVELGGISIAAFDLNPECVRRARSGRFSPWALRAVSQRILDRYFRRDGGEFVVAERVREMVSVEQRNLIDPDPAFWHPRAFDVIFCRNVLMYLSPRALEVAMNDFSRSLGADGYLFVGHAESLHGISRDFVLHSSNGAFYYRPRRDAGADDRTPARPQKRAAPALAQPFTAPPKPRADGKAGAAARVRNGSPKASATAMAKQLSDAISLSEALSIIDLKPPERRDDPDVMLLTAALLSERGRLAQAEELCSAILASDSLNPTAHYVRALCAEHRGNRAAAIQGYRTAIHLDPDFAMAHLRLAFALKRGGDFEAARGEFEQAMLLLGREDPARLLLFSGGFSRQALLDVCRREVHQGRKPA